MCRLVDFESWRNTVKIKEKEKRDKYLDLARKLKNAMEHEVDSDTSCNWCFQNDPERFSKRIRRVEIQRTTRTINTTALRSAKIRRRVLEI